MSELQNQNDKKNRDAVLQKIEGHIRDREQRIKKSESVFKPEFTIDRSIAVLLVEHEIKALSLIVDDIYFCDDSSTPEEVISYYVNSWQKEIMNCRWQYKSSCPWHNLNNSLGYQAKSNLIKLLTNTNKTSKKP